MPPGSPDKCLVEHLAEPPADRVVPADAVEAFQGTIPPDDALVEVEDHQPVVERFENVLVELPHAAELFGLQVQLPIQPAVLDRRRHLSGDSGQQREIFAVERLVILLPPQRQDGNRSPLEYTRHEIVDAGIAPELHLLSGKPRGRNGVVQRHGVSSIETRDKR